MDVSTSFFLNPHVVIRHLRDGGCLVEFPRKENAFKLNKAAKDIALSGIKGCRLKDWERKMPPGIAKTTMEYLINLDIIGDFKQKNELSERVERGWSNSLWDSDFDYFVNTLDIKFLDYSPTGDGYKNTVPKND